MLSLGSSKPWPDAMEVLTGQRKMDAGPLIEYFKPLSDFLYKYNKENNIPTGWEKSDSKYMSIIFLKVFVMLLELFFIFQNLHVQNKKKTRN